MNVLVTGGAGFIGSNLCRTLLARDEVSSVTVIDDLSSGRLQNLDGVDVRFVEGSILDPAALADATDGVDAIVHLAARPSVPRSIDDPLATNRVNIDGTLAVLERARTIDGCHVVFASSSSVYGANKELPKRIDMVARPVSPYAVSKLAGESYCLAYQACYGLSTLAVRFFNVYGPRQAAGSAYAPVIPAFIEAGLAGRPLPIHGDGHQSRDFTYVGSVAEVLTRSVVGKVASPTPMNLAFGVRFDLLEVVALLSDLGGLELAVDHLPERAGDVRHSQADPQSMRDLFGEIEPVTLTDGLAATLAWWRGETN